MKLCINKSVRLKIFTQIKTCPWEVHSDFFFFKIAMFKDFLNSRRKKKQGDYGSHQLREVQCCNHILLLFPLFPPLTGFKLWSYNDTLLGIWNFKGTDCLSTNKQLFKTAWILWSFKHKLWGLILVTLKANLGWVSHSLSPRASRSVRILMRFIIAAFPAFFSVSFFCSAPFLPHPRAVGRFYDDPLTEDQP